MADKRQERRRLAHVARNLTASRHLYRVSMVARVESEEDIPFWQHVYSLTKHDLKVKFLPSDTGSGPDARQRGKTVCMRYVGHLNKHFVICVDSDFDRFTRPGVLSPERFIYQTYTYSFENHHCWGEGLQQTWDALAVCGFDFRAFLTGLSRILYPVLIEMLAVKAARRKSWSLTELCGVILSAQVNRTGALENNGEALLEEIEGKVSAWSSGQVHPTVEACEKMKLAAANEGLTEETAYLFMQGHCVFDLVLRVGKTLCNRTHDFQYEVLMPSLEHCASAEMNRVLVDIKNIQ